MTEDPVAHNANTFRIVPGKNLLRVTWLLALLAVIVGSLLPSESSPIQTLARLAISDKVEHLGMYGLLAFLPSLRERRRVVIASALAAIAFGVGLEFAQLLTGWRDFEIGDMVADTLGVCFGLALGTGIRAYEFRRSGPKTASGSADAIATGQSGTEAHTPTRSAVLPGGRV